VLEFKLPIFGDGFFPPSIRNPYNRYINPYDWVDEFIPYISKKTPRSQHLTSTPTNNGRPGSDGTSFGVEVESNADKS